MCKPAGFYPLLFFWIVDNLAIQGVQHPCEPLSAVPQDDVTAISDLRVPRRWIKDLSGAEISWLSPTLGKWFSGMRLRAEQLCAWLEKGRPKSFWLAGFFNPTGFLTGMMQEVCCRLDPMHSLLRDQHRRWF